MQNPHHTPAGEEAPVVATPVEARQGRKGVRVLIILCVSLLGAVAAGFMLGLLRI